MIKDKIIEMSIDDIKPYEKNPRFNDNAVEYVKNSIKKFKYTQPIIVDKNKKTFSVTPLNVESILDHAQNYNIDNNASVGISYMGAFRKNYQEHTGMVNFRYIFE